ncbi:MAG: sugar ABC transporter permease [Phycisphaeraceae bacterium]|nr:MAG: sugar ABC transporter permease [Phycisphaeraceae bacterium]
MHDRKTQRVFGVATHLALVPLAIVTLIPFVWLVLAAFKTPEDFSGSLFLPRDDSGAIDLTRLTWMNFVSLFRDVGLGRAMLNSIFLSSMTAVLATLCAAAGGYALARFRFFGRNAMTLLVLGAIIIPPPLLLAPSYQLLFNLHLLDTFTGLILPAIAPAFGIFLFRQATRQSVPESLIEAARIDGASEVGIFVSIVLPLVRPMIGAFMLLTFLMVWNNFIGPQVVLQTAERYPLSVAVAQMRGLYRQDYGLLMAGTLVSILPVAGLFLLLQREFIQGLTSGAVKG